MRSGRGLLFAASVSCVLSAACGDASSSTPSDDGGGTTDAATDSAHDGTVSDGGPPTTDAAADAAPIDAGFDGTTPSGSTPPKGSSLCGSGSFGPADSMNVCQTSNPWFPPQYTVTKDCGGAGFSFTSGVWEAWCTPSSVYIFARFDGAKGFELVAPTGDFHAGNGGGSANAWFDVAKQRIIVEAPNVQPTAKSGEIYLLRFDGNTDAGTKFRMVGGVALSWK